MNEVQIKIIRAAISVFAQFGICKATLGDISKAAGVSRQTVYSYFSGKDEAFSAAMGYLMKQTAEKITQTWQDVTDLEKKLDVYFDLAIVEHYEQVSNVPDSGMLFERMNDESAVDDCALENPKLILLRELFKAYENEFDTKNISTDDLAEFIFSASSSFLFTARDKAQLLRLLKSLKHYVILLTQ